MHRKHHKLLFLLAAGLTATAAWAEPNASAKSGPSPDTPGAGEPATRKSPLEAPAADNLNRELPGWLKLSGEFRTRTESRTAFGYNEGVNDGYALFRTRLNIDVRPSSWAQFFVQAQDSRVAGIEPQRAGPVFKDPFDVRQAYVRFSTGEKVNLAVTAGRRLLKYGDQRLIGPLDWTNTSRAFDAVKLELAGQNARVDVFSASVVQNDPTRRVNHHKDGQNLHGVYGSVRNVIPHSIVEPYVLWKTAPLVVGEGGQLGDLDRYTGGVRIASKPKADLAGFDYNAAIVKQWGSFAQGNISAWGGYTTIGYTLSEAPLRPRFSAEYNYATGDNDPNDGNIGYFDNLYPTAHLWYGYTDLVGWRNIKNLRLRSGFKPHQKLKLAFDYHWFWLASRTDHLYNVAGRIAVRSPQGGASNTKVGDEVDITAAYALSKQLKIGAGFGHMFPGPYLKANSPGSPSSFSYLFAHYKF